MSSSRLTQLPFDHLAAELAAIPLGSEESLRYRITALNGRIDGATGDLWRAAEARLLRSTPSMSVDELTHHRDWLWFSRRSSIEHQRVQRAPTYQPLRLHEYARELALDLIDNRLGGARPTHPSAQEADVASQPAVEARARQAWRWFSFALPPDLLLAAHPEQPRRLIPLSQQLDRWLSDHGYAESHAHLGACLDFSMFWSAVQIGLADRQLRWSDFESPQADLDEGRLLVPWLMRAAVARLILGSYLYGYLQGRSHFRVVDKRPLEPTNLSFAGYVRTVVEPTVVRGRSGLAGLTRLRQCFRDLGRGRLTARGSAQEPSQVKAQDLHSIRELYLDLLPMRNRARRPSSRLEVFRFDPISRWVEDRVDETVGPETAFLSDVFRYLGGPQPDESFELIFWQTQKIRNMLYRHVVQRPMTPGLQWFIRFYDRLRPGKKVLEETCLLDSALVIAGDGHGLRSLEVRTAPYDTVADNHKFLEQVRCRSQTAGCEVGVVLHFIRSRGGRWNQGRPEAHANCTHGDPWKKTEYARDRWLQTDRGTQVWRFGALHRFYRNQACILNRLFQERPRAVEVLRGFDICTDESGVPLWVLVDTFVKVRRAANQATARLTRRARRPVAAPRATVHAGEDFIHLLTGLRRVDQAVRYLALEEGDRIGHALALGLQAERWASESGRIMQTKLERLLDLTWEWARSAGRGRMADSGRAEYLVREISRLASFILDEEVDAPKMEQLVVDLHDHRFLALIGFPNREPDWSTSLVPADGSDPSQALDDRVRRVRNYLSSKPVFQRGQELTWIEPKTEGAALAVLQAELVTEVQARGIVVEVNPSSNLLVGNLTDLNRHPLWNLKPLDGRSGLAIAVGSDDPLTFATDLRREFMLLHDALVLAGASQTATWRWLEEVRATGLRARFTIGSGADGQDSVPTSSLARLR